jgi:hypothetical protein
MLEEIRLLSNLETPNQKLVHILLLGQQELNTILKSPVLRQMKQRISVKFHIEPLNLAETHDYINHRLRVAGYEPREKPLFNSRSIKEIFSQTKGFPRLINTLCDNALLSAFIEDKKEVTASTVKKVANEIEASYGKEVQSSNRNKYIYSALGIIILSATVVGILLYPGLEESFLYDTTIIPLKTTSRSNVIDIENNAGLSISSVPASAFNKGKPSVKKIRAGKNASIESIAADYYGRINPEILNSIKLANPNLESLENNIENQEIVLPPLESIKSIYYSVCLAVYNTGAEARIVSDSISQQNMASGVIQYTDSEDRQLFAVIAGMYKSREEALMKSGELIGEGFFYAKPVRISMEG